MTDDRNRATETYVKRIPGFTGVETFGSFPYPHSLISLYGRKSPRNVMNLPPWVTQEQQQTALRLGYHSIVRLNTAPDRDAVPVMLAFLHDRLDTIAEDRDTTNPAWHRFYLLEVRAALATFDRHSTHGYRKDVQALTKRAWRMLGPLEQSQPSPVTIDLVNETHDLHFALFNVKQDETRYEFNAIRTKVKPYILERDGGRCRLCAAKSNLEIDHIFPVERGGQNYLINLRTLCTACNHRKRDHLIAGGLR